MFALVQAQKFMSKIAIIVDSTSGINLTAASKQGNLFMIPLYFIFGEEMFEDLIDLNTEEFFVKAAKYYDEFNILPTTSQPSVGRCMELYEELLTKYDHIIYFTLSSKLSGTYQNGVIAAMDFGDKVTVYDSLQTSVSLNYIAFNASNMAKEDKSIDEILAMANNVVSSTHTYLVVDDLKHLVRTGRIGPAAGMLGNALQLKPILEFKNGEVISKEKIRNISKAHKRIFHYLDELKIDSNDKVYVVGADAKEYVHNFTDEFNQKYPNIELEYADLSPVIAVNTGPKTIGVFIIKDILGGNNE